MPTYVYHCRACDQTFEADQRIVEPPLDSCNECGEAGTVKRIIQPIAVMFKGSGFHINDYAPKATSPSDAKSHGEKTEGEKSEGEKSDGAKPEEGKSGDAKAADTSSGSDAPTPPPAAPAATSTASKAESAKTE